MDITLYCHVWCIEQLITSSEKLQADSAASEPFNWLKVEWLLMHIFQVN